MTSKHLNKNIKFVRAFYEANGQTYGEPADFTLQQFLLTKELQDKEDLYGLDHPELWQTLYKLGLTYFGQGEFEEAENHWGRALKVQEKCLNRDDLQVLETMRCLAILACYPLKRIDEAENILQEIAVRNRVFFAETLNNLSAIFVQQKDFGAAADVYERALEAWTKELGEENAAIPDMLDNLAGLYYYQGNFEKAESTSKRALKLAEKVLAAGDPGITKISNNYAIMSRQS